MKNTRPKIFKNVLPTIEKVKDFKTPKEGIFVVDNPNLDELPIKIWFSEECFKFNFRFELYSNINQASTDIIEAFNNGSIKINNDLLFFQKNSVKSLRIKPSSGEVSGELSTVIQNSLSTFSEKFNRVIIPIKSGHFQLIENFKELETDQNIKYITGFHNTIIGDEVLSISNIKNDTGRYLLVDSNQNIEFKDFMKRVDSLIYCYSFLFGSEFESFYYLVNSTDNQFKTIVNIAFFQRTTNLAHSNPIFDSNELKKYGFIKSHQQIQSSLISNFCQKYINDKKFAGAIKLCIEGNQNNQPLSKAILYSLCLETFLSSMHIKATNPIEKEIFEKSDITIKLSNLILDNDSLGQTDKKYLIEKKIKHLNTPTNPDKFKTAFKEVGISLSEKFTKVLKYRNYFLHGSSPDAIKLGAIESNILFMAYELQFLANTLILKSCGFKGYLKHYSTEIEYYTKVDQEIIDEEINLKYELYIKI